MKELKFKAARRAPPKTVDTEGPFELKDPPAVDRQALSQAEVQECDMMDQKWRE